MIALLMSPSLSRNALTQTFKTREGVGSEKSEGSKFMGFKVMSKSWKSLIAGVVVAAGTTLPAKADGWLGPDSYSTPGIWNGLYAGVQGGWTRSRIDGSFVDVPITWDLDKSSGILGGQIGVQQQFGSIVFGVEADFVTAVGDRSATGACQGPGADECGPVFLRGQTNNIWSVGPRLGWAAGAWMPYATGGYASASIENQLIAPGEGPVASSHERENGWYVGGSDWALSPNVIFGIEYRHYQFTEDTITPRDNLGIPVPEGRWTLDPSADSVTARLSFKLDTRAAEPAPLK